ncbi:MAG: tRNA threonylcarbamoyladenosine dehydratase [Clostridia bacterium]|nr:tRNA threonylcarbamoyladenosine dehydratase [Clostridia bacterium]
MYDFLDRTSLMLGEQALLSLQNAKVLVVGVGGVGGYTVEALARSGVGSLTLIDGDTVAISNINRQIVALHSTLGRYKVDVMRERILDINPLIKVNALNIYYAEDTDIDLSTYDYIVDAIDSVKAKLLLIKKAKEVGVPIISCMGAGNKLSATSFRVADIYSTSSCPLAKAVRRGLKDIGIDSLKVVYSIEPPIKSGVSTPQSISYAPAIAGITLASEVILDIARVDR